MAEQATGKASATETAQEPEAARSTDAAAETAQGPEASEDAGTGSTSSPSRRSSRASGTDKGTTGGKRTSSGTGRKPSGGRAGAGSRGAKGGQKAPAGKDHQEVEWQFDADDLGAVEGWLRESAVGSGVVLGTVSSDDLVDGYYDTGDWRLYRAGYALRIREARSGTEATMKSLSGAEGNLRRRREISEPLKDAEIGTLRKSRGPVGEKLRLLLGDREAGKIFQVRTSRKTFPLSLAVEASEGATSGSSNGEIVQDASGNVREVSGDGASGVGGSGRVGEVVLDSSEIPFGEAEESTGLTRVEVEVDAGAASDRRLRGFVKEMEVSLGLRPARISKYEAGIFATGLSPESREDYGPTGVDASLSLGEMAFAVLRKQFAVMGSHEPGTRLGEDAEELHDMRVATRRLRAAMKLFEDVLPERSRWLREELRHFAGSLGAVRDLDVQIEEIKGVGGGDQEEVEALAAIVTGLGERREAARKRLLETLDSDRYDRFESSFAEMLRRGPEGSGGGGITGAPSTNGSSEAPAADAPVLEAAPALLGRRYRAWSKAAGRLHEGSRPEDYHELRKKGKRLRYALEFFSGVYGEEATGKLVKPLKAVQDSLGRHQDVIVAADLLHEIAITTPRLPKRTVFAMGLLAQRYHAEAEALRTSSTAAKEYRALAGGKLWKGFEKLMKGESRAAEKSRKGSGKGKKKGK
ncbi:MAG: Adenylate cyclase [uncultured Rubrobacteraceae bacterium]|uniref:Adenylate cyclase n=1 Tax=uncultured Rubrobacteraceae bacterium TaxID=349277 RepID=A0A6J4SD17_9ACTN|nr:MAG: Adenylate cyclase [uncultured Rubrobacteraceae bacterium]